MDTFNLFWIRVKSFLAEASVLCAVAFIGVLASEDFANLMTQEFGEVWGGGFAVLLVNGIVKHLLNLKAIKDYEARKYSSSLGEEVEPLVLV